VSESDRNLLSRFFAAFNDNCSAQNSHRERRVRFNVGGKLVYESYMKYFHNFNSMLWPRRDRACVRMSIFDVLLHELLLRTGH
jgi:hypothetical protein